MTHCPMTTRRAGRLHAAGMIAASLAILVGVTSCGVIGNITRVTTIELHNGGEYPVDVDMYVYDEQLAPLPLIIADGENIDPVLAPGTRRVYVRNCDDLQAVVIADADLEIVGSIGPSASSGVLRDGDDFSCGSIIVFRFDHSNAIIDFDVTANVIGD